MRVHLIAATLFVAALTGQAAGVAAQEAEPGAASPAATAPPPKATPRGYEPGVMAPIDNPPEAVAPRRSAPRRRPAKAPPQPVAVAEAPAEAMLVSLVDAPTLAHQLTIIRAEEAHMDVLGGKSGPFAQAIAAWRVRDWYHFTFAMATLLVGAIILAIMVAVTASTIRRRREAAR